MMAEKLAVAYLREAAKHQGEHFRCCALALLNAADAIEEKVAAAGVEAGSPLRAHERSNETLVAMLLSHLYRLYDAGGLSGGRSWESRLVEPALRLMDPYRPRMDIVDWPDREATIREAEQRVRLLSAPVTSGWQPIATVPQDRRWVLVWSEDMEYCVYRFGPGLIEAEGPQPTHWMPLPAAPVSSEEHK
jgi:hypothetical protein